LLTKCRGIPREYYVAVLYKYDRDSDCYFKKIKKKGKKYIRKAFPSDMIDLFNTRAIANTALYRLYWSY